MAKRVGTYDKQRFAPWCASCGRIDSFSRSRAVEEREMLGIQEGEIDRVDSDTDVVGEWVYRCDHCGVTADSLEEILLEPVNGCCEKCEEPLTEWDEDEDECNYCRSFR